MSHDTNASETTDAVADPWLARAHILVVDDEPGMRNFLTRTLSPRCARVEAVGDTAAAGRLIDASHFDLIILDNIMAGRTGLDWLAELRRDGFFTEVILITAFADLETAIEALRAGAADFVLKPFRTKQILNAIARCLDRAALRRENFVLRRQLGGLPKPEASGRLVGTSPQMARIREMVTRAAATPTTVLITGESGTAKEITARALHEQSPYAAKPFVPVNCAAIAAEIIESELFGHVKGAFTGAIANRDGRFTMAHQGTLFLDEIGDMPLAIQAKLLRAIQEQCFEPVGSTRTVKVDVRIVAATHRDLRRAVEAGQFREDLFYRLNVFPITVPPLNQRTGDVPLLAQRFLQQHAASMGKRISGFSPAALAAMESYDWPGNVRELQNCVERAVIVARTGIIDLPDLPRYLFDARMPSGASTRLPGDLDAELSRLEREMMLEALRQSGGVQARAAERLGISERSFWHRMKKLEIRIDRHLRDDRTEAEG